MDADGLGVWLHSKEFLAVCGIAEVALKNFNRFGYEFYRGVALQHKGAHGIAAFQKLCADIGAHKSGSAGDKIDGFHIRILRFGCCFASMPLGYTPKINLW